MAQYLCFYVHPYWLAIQDVSAAFLVVVDVVLVQGVPDWVVQVLLARALAADASYT